MIQTTPGEFVKAELDAPAGLTLTGRVKDNGVLVQTVPGSAVTYDESYTAVFPSPGSLGRMTFEWLNGATVIASEVLWVQAVVTPVQRIAGQPGTIELENAPTGLTLTARLQDNGVTVLDIPTEAISFDEAYIGTLTWPAVAGRFTVQWLQAGVVIASEVVETTAFTPGYCTVDELRKTLAPGGNTGPGTAAGLPDEELLRAITRVDQEIDARCSDRYAVPFDPVPGLITEIAADLAAFRATLTHRKGNPLDPNDPVRLRYAEAKALLLSIAKGDVDLIGAAGEDIQSGSGAAMVVNPYEGELFGMCDLGLVQTYGPYGPHVGPGVWP